MTHVNLYNDNVAIGVHWPEFFSEQEYNMMYSEIEFLCQDEFLLDSKEAGGASDSSGQMLRQNKGVILESIFNDNNSDIHRCTRRIFENETLEQLLKLGDVFHYLRMPTKETNLVNHYMDTHSYSYHRDACVMSALTVFHKIPKPYTGGQLKIRYGTREDTIMLQPRDLFIFPSYVEHCVTPISLLPETDKSDMMNGRISISKFIKLV
jgi:predicted 2-oxoglutarate/Fe(II)-dependent dioxygenase YbiX